MENTETAGRLITIEMKLLSLAITKILLLVALVWFTSASDDHDHDEDGDEDHHDELWHGHYQFDQAVYTLNLQRTEQEYVDKSLKIAILKNEINMDNTTEAAISSEIQALFEASLPRVGQGEIAQLGSTPSKLLNYISVDLFELIPDAFASNTVIKLSVVEPGKYVIFANHLLSEWEGALKFIMDVHGSAVVAEDSSQCHSTLSSSAVWGLSILGAMIGAVMSLSGVLIITPVIRMQELWILKYLNFFAAGVLLSFVLIHLIPEAGHLTGKNELNSVA
eukprot:762715-Hanusia_phi.AAC.4